MDSFYGYETSLEYWRTVAQRNREPRIVSRMPAVGNYVRTELQEFSQRPNWLTPSLIEQSGGSVHGLVFHQGYHKSVGKPKWHLWQKVPEGAFSPAGERSFVSSPEFCFLQMASILSVPELVMLGMELCGGYCLDPAEDEGLGKRSVPLTSREKLADFIACAHGLHGHRQAQKALTFVLNHSASPMETAVVMLLHLPYRYGGYGLPAPTLNLPIPLEGRARKLYGASVCYGDICWQKPPLDLEYLGVEAHVGSAKMLADRSRTLAIAEMGFQVIEITKEQVFDLEAFDIIARRIAKILGRRLREESCGATPERKRLASTVLATPNAPVAVPVQEADAKDADNEGIVFGRIR